MPSKTTKKTGRREIRQLDRPLLIRLYCEQPLSVDKLPYTTQMDDIVRQYNERHTREPAAHYEIYQTLVILRKNRKLVRRMDTSTTNLLF